MQAVQPGEIQEAPIHDIETAGLGDQDVEHVDLVQLAIADVDERGDIAAQVEQGMQLHRGFGGTEVRPRKDGEAQIDRGGIQRVSRLLQLHGEAVVDIKLSGCLDQTHGEVRIDAPIAGFVGIGQGAPGDMAADTQMIELGLMGT